MQANPDNDCTGAYDCEASSHIDGCYANDLHGETLDNECLVDHCLLDDPKVQQLVGGGGDPPGIDNPRAEFIRQLGELIREHDDVLVASIYFIDGARGAAINLRGGPCWLDSPENWLPKRG